MLLRNLLGVFIVILLSLWAVQPLFVSGFFPMHDDEQVARLFDLDQAIKAGHIPPRIAPNLGFGYGYPFFNFYPSFVYYIAEIFVLIGFSYITSIKLMITLGFFFAAIAMYFFVKQLFGNVAGLVAAVAYTYAPYHAVDVYVRGALPEFWTLVFIPAIFWAYYMLYKSLSRKYTIVACVLNACLVLTHNLVALMSAPFIGLFLIYLLEQTPYKKTFLIQIGISILLGLGLSAYFWLPSFFEKQYTMVDLLTTELAHYSHHFVYLRQLWDSPWGYGGSIYGLFDGLTFQIGKIHIFLTVFSFIAFLYAWIRKKRLIWVFVIFFGMYLLSIFLMTFHAKFLWDVVLPLSYVQFPWRFLLLTSFFSSAIAGFLFTENVFTNKKIRIVFAIILIFLLIVSYKDFFVPKEYLRNATDNDYTNKQKIRYETSKLAAEYTPKGIATRKTDINTTVVDIDKEEIAKTSYEVIRGRMTVTIVEDLPQRKKFTVKAESNGVLRLNTYTFPGWKVFIDGREVPYRDDNRLKLITIDMPAGTHQVQAIFTNTRVRLLGNTISIVSLCSIIALIFISRKFHFKAF